MIRQHCQQRQWKPTVSNKWHLRLLPGSKDWRSGAPLQIKTGEPLHINCTLLCKRHGCTARRTRLKSTLCIQLHLFPVYCIVMHGKFLHTYLAKKNCDRNNCFILFQESLFETGKQWGRMQNWKEGRTWRRKQWKLWTFKIEWRLGEGFTYYWVSVIMKRERN